MTIQKRFKVKENFLDAVDAKWLNSLEQRLNKIENISVHAPLQLQNTLNGIVLTLGQHIDEFTFAQLAGELLEDNQALVNLAVRDSTQSPGSQWAEDSTQQVIVVDPVGTRIPDNSIGMVFRQRKADSATRIFWPFPIRVFAVQLDADVLSASIFTADLLNLDGSAGTASTSITVDNAIGLWDDLSNLDQGYVIKIDNTYYGIFFDTTTYTFNVSGDTGSTETVEDGDTLNLDGATGTFSTRPESEWGFLTKISKGGTTINADMAVNESVLQQFRLTGTATSGDTTIPIEDSRVDNLPAGGNLFTYIASATLSPVTLAGVSQVSGSDASMEFGANDPFFIINGDTGSENLDFKDVLDLEGDDQIITAVSKVTTTTKTIIKNDFGSVRGLGVGGFTSSTSTVVINTIKVKFGRDPGSSVTAHNIYGMDGDDGDTIECNYNHEDGQWEMIQKVCTP